MPTPPTPLLPQVTNGDLSSEDPQQPHLHSVFSTARPTDWLKIGFYFALGIVLLLVAAVFLRTVLFATLAIITPFILGTALALLLDPLTERIQQATKFPRIAAAGIVFGTLVLILIGLISLVVPALVNEATALASNSPQYLAKLTTIIDHFLHTHKKFGLIKMPTSAKGLASQLPVKATALLQQSSGQITSFLIGSVTTLVEMVLGLVITFFMLVDLKKLRARLMFLAPPTWRRPMKLLSSDIGTVFSQYVRGLIIVCAMYGLFTTILLYTLSIIHHDLAGYALLVGVTAGALYAVPYLGSFTTAILIFIVGFASGGAGFGGIAVLSSLVLNQVFDNIVTPKVIGGGVGLHPVVAIFALVLGGEMFGIAGMLLSVPVAASIQVVLFRLVPKSTAPTPDKFLVAQGVDLSDREATKVSVGEDSVTEERQEQQRTQEKTR